MTALVDRANGALRRVPPWTLYILGALWAGWLFYLGLTGGLGPEPINALEREYGSVALQLMVAVLLVTPLRRYLGLNLIRFRRQIGLLAFYYVLAHFAVYAVLDVQSFDRVWADIVKRPFVTVGFAALVLLVPIAVTSNNASIRRLGAGVWKRLHWLTYPAAILGAAHYVWLVKGWPIEPFVYLGAVVVLLGIRLWWRASARIGQPKTKATPMAPAKAQ